MKNYVYKHVCPDTGEVVYVGIGTGSRAWSSGKGTGRKHTSNSLRTIEHADWLNGHLNNGVSPVEFIACNVSRPEALEIEREHIAKHSPRFNKIGTKGYGESRSSITKEQAIKCRQLRDEGLSYKAITEIVWPGSVGAMKAHRVINKFNLEYL